MPANLAAVERLLKEHFEQPFTDAMDRDITLLKRIKRKSGVVGKEAQWKLHYAGNDSAGSYTEEAEIPVAGAQAHVEARSPYRQNWVAVEVTGLAQAATRGGGGYMEALGFETEEAIEDLKDQLNDQLVAFTPAVGTDIDGLGFIVSDTGTYAGIDRTVHTWFQSLVLANGAVDRDLSLVLMQQMLTGLRTPERKSKVSVVMTDQELWYTYGNLFQEYRRWEGTEEIDGGIPALKFDGIPVIAIPNMAHGSMFFLDEREWSYHVLENFKTKEKSTNKDSDRFIITHYSQLVCKHTGRQGVISDLT